MIIGLTIGAITPLAYAIYWQVIQGEPWGKEPMSDLGLIGLTLFIVACMGIMCVCVAYTKLELRIDEQGVHYRFSPYRLKWSLISKEEIETYEVTKMSTFLGMCSVGYHRNIMNNSRTMNLQGTKQLALQLRNKRKILIGTVNPGGAALAMKKLFNPNDYN